MDEVDKIIIESLKHLGCDISEDIHNLREFDADMNVMALSTCLESIDPSLVLSKKLPHAMIAKLKLASNLAEHVKNFGFLGDMGYQSILYCNEAEIRRVLMYLIERLPRENTKIIPVEQTGYVPRMVKNIERNLRLSLKHMWIPSSFVKNGVVVFDDCSMVRSFGNSSPLQTHSLDLPNPAFQNEELAHYWDKIGTDVTKQCPSSDLIPSLLFKDFEILRHPVFSSLLHNQEYTFEQEFDRKNINTSLNVIKSPSNEDQIDPQVEKTDVKLNKIAQEVEELKTNYVTLTNQIQTTQLKLSQAIEIKNEEQEVLKQTLSKIKFKTKTLAVMNNEENKAKLENLVQNISDRLIELANQWHEVQTPLLNEYKALQSSLTAAEANFQEESRKLEDAKTSRMKLTEDLKEKTTLETKLIEKCQQIPRNNTRAAYTQRILEIIGNITKQNNEIRKFLKDTRDIQKEIHRITGQVDRSFTLSDELIFYDAKNDETARKAYKLLALLRDECYGLLKAVRELGKIERECRNLQEQIETERSKDIACKLDRVYSDLAQIQKESMNLVLEN